MSKIFIEEIKKFVQKLRFGEPFAFVRYSDGEMMMLKGWELELGKKIIFGEKGKETVHNYSYPKEDHKKFDPQEHSWFRDKLMDSFLFEKEGYYKGLISSNSAGELYDYQFEVLKKNKSEVTSEEHYTFADLFVNSNYPYFLEHLLPYFFNYETIMICNESADIDSLPFKVKKDFRVGYNCMINNYDIINDIKKYIDENNIQNHLFLFSASALSETAIHQLYNHCDKNTYLDIGTCLNHFMNITIDRNYLRGFWLNSGETDIRLINQW